jgi:3',5'-cyclic AMP phosphodiesterase CpdA
MNLWAISDLHLGFRANRDALADLPPHGPDWVILGGDVGETEEHLDFAIDAFTRRFARVIWVPGNHELWTMPARAGREDARGEAKYDRLVALCRRRGVLTPEDPYPVWNGPGGPLVVAPLFLLYDYSFRPDEVPAEGAVAWAEEKGIVATDEQMLHPDPYPSKAAWCAARVAYTERRLEALGAGTRLVIVNHFPLHEDLLKLRLLRRFSIWCGTRATRSFHTRFPVEAVVYGHMHRRATDVLDGVRFEEVSLGYPRDWSQQEGISTYLRRILPAPATAWEEPPSWVPPSPPDWLLEKAGEP